MTIEEVYDEQINPLMAQIIAIAQEHKIPMFASFDLDPGGDWFCTTSLNIDECPQLIKCFQAVRANPGFAAFTITTIAKPA